MSAHKKTKRWTLTVDASARALDVKLELHRLPPGESSATTVRALLFDMLELIDMLDTEPESPAPAPAPADPDPN